jgi:hypothetical protein
MVLVVSTGQWCTSTGQCHIGNHEFGRRSKRRPRDKCRQGAVFHDHPIRTAPARSISLSLRPQVSALQAVAEGSVRLQALALFESLYRPGTNAALAVVGLYGAFSKNKDMMQLYFVFLALSCLTDLIWMISWGPMLGRDFPERESIERFALAISIMEFILKVNPAFSLAPLLPPCACERSGATG